MVNLNFDKVKRVVASVDWGFRHPGVIGVWAIDGDGIMYLVYEIYKTGELIEWWVQQARAAKDRFRIEVFVCDPSEPSYIEQFRRAGLNAIGANNEVLPGIDKVGARLRKQADGRPRLFVFKDCLAEVDQSLKLERKPYATAQEFDGYIWSTSTKEQPIKEYDHGMDMLRYGVTYLDAEFASISDLPQDTREQQSRWLIEQPREREDKTDRSDKSSRWRI